MHGKYLSMLLMLVVLLGFQGRKPVIAEENEEQVTAEWKKVKELYVDMADNAMKEGETCDGETASMIAMSDVAGIEPVELAKKFKGAKAPERYKNLLDSKNKDKVCAAGLNLWCDPTRKECKCCDLVKSAACKDTIAKVVKDRHPDSATGLCGKGTSSGGGSNTGVGSGTPGGSKKKETASGSRCVTPAVEYFCCLFLLSALTAAIF